MKTILLILTLLINCQSKNSDEEEKKRILAGVLISRFATGSSSTTSSNVSCAVATPNFSTLASAGVNSSCGRSGCHSGSSPQSGYDATSYSSTLSRVTARNANGSLIYQKVNGGSMAPYSNSQINQAIFCWIQGGAIQ